MWQDFLSCIREYFILDGRSKRVHNFHFVFLNHFRYKQRVSFIFYLKYSLIKNLNTHRKNISRLVLHEGLVLLIEEYCRENVIKLSPSSGKIKKIYGKEILDKSSVKIFKMHNVKIEEIKDMDTESNSN